MARWLQGPRAEAPVRVAQIGGVLPLPPRLIAAFLGSTSQGQAGPPRPPSQGSGPVEPTPPAEIARLAEKSTAGELPLLAGWNLISLPQEPTDPDPAAVFADIAGHLARAEVYDACDVADPWKEYDPADPTGSDLTAVDHRRGMWVKATSAVILPTGDTPPATTTMELCEGWNLIGFPAGQSRHPHVALSSIAGKWQRVFAYDAFDPEDPWELFDPATPDWANDLRLMHPGRGYWVLASEAATLEIQNEGPPPTVTIASPADLAVVTEPTEIVGTVDSDRLESWTLTYRPIGDDEAVTLATGNSPVAGGALATFDPTLLLNGLYELELTATDVQGQQVSESIAVSVEGQMKIGHFTLSFVDLAIPVSGLDIEIVRTYDSRDLQQHDFGVGWNLEVRQGSYRNNRPPGDGWQLQNGFLPCDTVVESKSHLTVVRLSDREVYRFALQLQDGRPSTSGGCFADARFDFVDGPIPGATLEILGQTQVFYENGSTQVIDVDTLALYEPQNVRLTTRDGRIFELDLDEGVTRVEDLNGNRLSITPAGISHSSGRGIVFERDVEGRIARITDPMDQVMNYGYDSAGDLVSFTDRAGAVTRFTYDDHRLRDVVDPRGVQPIRNEFDAEGRLVRHVDAFGKIIELGHDRENRREVVTNRLGHSRVLEYDARGNVVREIDEGGQATVRSYDSDDRLLTETDPLGRTTTHTYTAPGELASTTDPLGQSTAYTYSARGEVLTITNTRGGVTTNVYDSRRNLLRTTDPGGGVTSFTYDAAGNLLALTDPLGHVTSFEYDAFGNLTKETGASGEEATYIYDANSRRLSETRIRTLDDGSTETLVTAFTYDPLDRASSTTYPDGSTTQMVYDILGNVIQQIDELGRTTAITYDLMGRHVRTDFPDGTSVSQEYDAEGRLLERIDRAGRTIRFTYDASGRRLTTTYSGGATESSSYDAAGQRITATDARGHGTTFTYDAAGRVTSSTDALGSTRVFTYDASGNQTSVTDEVGHTTTLTYDALDRLVRTAFPDGSVHQVGYDLLGQRISETDPAGAVTRLGYDASKRLVSVTDALDQVTSYAYDEVGNLLTQSDANGHVTRFEYDRRGRRVKRILPDGVAETMSYNADGTLASHGDFSGNVRTFEYDAGKRLTRRTYPDGSQVSKSYTPTGRIATVTDARGTTTYAYDLRDRLMQKTDPGGRRLTYGYDLSGNLAEMAVAVDGQTYTTAYAYDALNRLTTVTDSRGEVTALGYDPNGNRTSLAYPNGLTTSYEYDALNRLTELSTRTSEDEIAQSYSYTLAASGNRARVDEHDGISRHYLYDVIHRLSQERVDDPQGGAAYQADLTLDPVGNRRQHTVVDGGGTSDVASTYDPRDRLLSAGTASYEWDENGSLVERVAGETTTFTWDFDQRLSEAVMADGTTVRYAYDADGNRARTQTVPPEGAATTVEYLVDTQGLLPHVVAELVDGRVETLYTRAGDQLLSLHRVAAGETKYAHHDGLGSTRLLSDSLGTTTDRYAFTAFGELRDREGTDPNPYLFAGEAFEPALGLYYNRARWLSPAAGRFLSMDPVGPEMTLPASVNRYVYAFGDPVNVTDPTGLFPNWLNLILVGIQVHARISGHFFVDQLNLMRIPYTNRSITTILGIHHSTCKPAGASCLVRPDLVSMHGSGFAEVYEIKTIGQKALGATQLAAYIALLTANDKLGRAWVPGTTYVPEKTIVVVAAGLVWPVKIFPPQNGLILYELGAVSPRVLVRFAVAAGVATAISVVAMTGLTAAIKARTPAFAY